MMGRAFEVRKASMAKTSAAKSKVYAKFGKEIYMAAKTGEPDVEMNVNLKRIVEKAKSNQVPSDIIKRAIDKAKGSSKENYESILYEGFGAGGSNLMIECLSDNVNRTISEVRNCFTKTNGKLGVSGALQHLFSHVAMFVFNTCVLEDEILEKLMENDLEYIELEVEDEYITIQCEIVYYNLMRKLIESLREDIKFEVSEILWLPNSYIELEADDKNKFDKLLEMLNECEDVQDIYHNVENNDENI
ncbi:MAG: YebC/PmpR family DNA-binding transcriptional regulator [Bacilli bacterium]